MVTQTFAFIAQSGEESMLVASLRDIISKQTTEVERLQTRLNELSASTAAATAELELVSAILFSTSGILIDIVV